MKKYLCVIIAVVLCLGLGVTYAKLNDTKMPVNAGEMVQETACSVISVYGEAMKEVTPDHAKINVSIENTDMDIKVAKDNTFLTFNNALEKLKEMGIPVDKIVVENFSSYPNYDYTSGKKLLGYYATLNFSVKTTDMSMINSLINGLIEVGITNINNIEYSITNANDVYNEVLVNALDNAKVKAQNLSKIEGLSLVKINEENVGYSSNLVRNYNADYAKQVLVGKIVIKARLCAEFSC